MSIPYSAAARPDTGVTNATVGIWLFIAAEVMLFGSLFSAYALLRAGAPSWPDQAAILNVPLASLNTVVLLLSSAAAVTGVRALAAGHVTRFVQRFSGTMVLGVAFLVIKGVEYADEIGRGLRPATNNFMGLYFVLTGLHVLHLAGGLAVLAWLLVLGRKMPDAPLLNRARVLTSYWNFVDVMWLFIFVTLYLL